MRISNHSGDVHPMYLHGHHAVVLARDGVASTGSPWWTDSLNVGDGEWYDIAFRADNPGIWADHCHNLAHARDGLIVHLTYEGVTTPLRRGRPDWRHARVAGHRPRAPVGTTVAGPPVVGIRPCRRSHPPRLSGAGEPGSGAT
jgi:hypothetical protein